MNLTTDDPTFADRLLARREQLGLTLDDLADRITEAGVDVKKNAVWKWEKKKTRPTRDKLEAIATALELDEETIVAWWAGIDTTEPNESGLRVVARLDGKPLNLTPKLRRQLEMLVEAEVDDRDD